MIDAPLLEKTREAFFQKGISMAQWARKNNFKQVLVYAVLSGRSKASRGESHQIAVRLGLKGKSARTFNVKEEKM